MVYISVFFSSKCSLFHKSNIFGSCIIHILYTECAKIKKIIPAQKGLCIIALLKRHWDAFHIEQMSMELLFKEGNFIVDHCFWKCDSWSVMDPQHSFRGSAQLSIMWLVIHLWLGPPKKWFCLTELPYHNWLTVTQGELVFENFMSSCLKLK